jgi:hypothetical protein
MTITDPFLKYYRNSCYLRPPRLFLPNLQKSFREYAFFLKTQVEIQYYQSLVSNI